MNKVNVLITAASRRVSLIRNFRVVQKEMGGKVISVDYNTQSPALYFSNGYYTVPLVRDPAYVQEIEEICRHEDIQLIIPTIDDELQLWAEHKEAFREKGIWVSISPKETVDICNDKWDTFRFFKGNGLPFPETYFPKMLTYDMEFPLFVKPRIGRGSVNTFLVKNKKHLDFFIDYVPNPIVQDYLVGKEFTVDCFFSNEGELISYIPRYRLVIRAGVSDRGQTFSNDDLFNYIQKIGRLLKFEGAINIQGKISKGEIKFFEINPRFSGGIQLSTAAGPNFAELLMREIQGEQLQPLLHQYHNRLTMTSFEDSLYLDANRKIKFFSTEHADVVPKKNLRRLPAQES